MSNFEEINTALDYLKSGKVVIVPTDTVIGLCLSLSASSAELLYDIKKRSSNKPIAILVSQVQDLQKYGQDVSFDAAKVARAFWPGPLSIIVKASNAVPKHFRAKDSSVALRMPNNDTCLELIRVLGCPLVCTSANISDKLAVSDFELLDKEISAKAAFVLRDDSVKSGLASSILDCRNNKFRQIREGEISWRDICAAIASKDPAGK